MKFYRAATPALATALIASFALSGCSQDNSGANQAASGFATSTASPSTPATPAPNETSVAPPAAPTELATPVDLAGRWTNVTPATPTDPATPAGPAATADSPHPAMPTMEAIIDEIGIHVRWIVDPSLGEGKYWEGTFDTIVVTQEPATILSTKNEEALGEEWMASPSMEKQFTYTGGKLSFPVEFGSDTIMVELTRAE